MGIKIKDNPEKDIELFLEQRGGAVLLSAIGKDGIPWNIMSFRSDGSYWRNPSIGEDSGFLLDSRGRIAEVD